VPSDRVITSTIRRTISASSRGPRARAAVTNYNVLFVKIANASASLSTSTFGVSTGVGGTGVTVVAGGTANTGSTNAANTVNNMLQTAGSGSTSYNAATLVFRVGTAQRSAATADALIEIAPLY
jgi:hypothetical protein